MYSQRALERLLPFDNVADMSAAQESRVERRAWRAESSRKLEDSLPTFPASPPELRAMVVGGLCFLSRLLIALTCKSGLIIPFKMSFS